MTSLAITTTITPCPKHRRLTWLGLTLAAALLPCLFSPINTQVFLDLQQTTRLMPDMFWHVVTELGEPLLLLPIILMWGRREQDGIKFLLITLILCTLLIHGLKHLVASPRPLAVLGNDIHVIGDQLLRRAFPSGHTATIFAAATFVYLYAQGLWRYWLLPVALVVGLSRISVGAHWPSDVLAGATVGILSAVAGQYLAQRWTWRPSMEAGLWTRGLVIILACVWIIDQLH